jgi:hypothetical protein
LAQFLAILPLIIEVFGIPATSRQPSRRLGQKSMANHANNKRRVKTGQRKFGKQRA